MSNLNKKIRNFKKIRLIHQCNVRRLCVCVCVCVCVCDTWTMKGDRECDKNERS